MTTTARGLTLPAVGADTGVWGGYLNTDLTSINRMFGDVLEVAVASGATLSLANVQYGTIRFTGTLTASVDVTFPNVSGQWLIDNRTTGAFYVRLKFATGSSATIGVPQGKTTAIYCDTVSGTAPGVKFANPPDPGTFWDFAGATAPAWFDACTSDGSTAQLPWLNCDGSIYAIATYPYLAAILGTTWGGDGVTTFGVPDLRNRFRTSTMASAPRISTAVSGVNGSTRGSVGVAQSSTLAIANMPAHDHGGSTSNPTTNPDIATGYYMSKDDRSTTAPGGTFYTYADHVSPTLPNHIHTISSQGSGTAFSTLPPTAIIGLTFVKT